MIFKSELRFQVNNGQGYFCTSDFSVPFKVSKILPSLGLCNARNSLSPVCVRDPNTHLLNCNLIINFSYWPSFYPYLSHDHLPVVLKKPSSFCSCHFLSHGQFYGFYIPTILYVWSNKMSTRERILTLWLFIDSRHQKTMGPGQIWPTTCFVQLMRLE